MEELRVPRAVEDDHGDAVWILGRANDSDQVLSNDVPQKGSLAGPGHPEHNPLHHPNAIRPKPRPSMHVVAKDNGILAPGLLCVPLILLRRDEQRRVGPLLFTAGAAGREQIYARINCGEGDGEVRGELCDLAARQVISLTC